MVQRSRRTRVQDPVVIFAKQCQRCIHDTGVKLNRIVTGLPNYIDMSIKSITYTLRSEFFYNQVHSFSYNMRDQSHADK